MQTSEHLFYRTISLAASLIYRSFTVPSIFRFNIDFFVSLLSEVYKSGNNREIMTSSSSDKICIRCGDPLNHVGAQYCDDQNEKHSLKTILKRAHGLKLNNLASNIAENLQNKTPTFIYHVETTSSKTTKSRPRNRLIEDAQQSSVKRVARRFNPGLYDFKSQCFYSKKLELKTKIILMVKTLKL